MRKEQVRKLRTLWEEETQASDTASFLLYAPLLEGHKPISYTGRASLDPC